MSRNLSIDTPLTELRGVGAERASQLARLKLHKFEDLLLNCPRRYEDRRRFRPIARMELGEAAITRGRIVTLGLKRYSQSRKSIFEIILEDGTGRLHCRWWNLPYMQNYFQQGDEVLVYGKLKDLKPRTIDHPETEVIDDEDEDSIHLDRVVPIYSLTEGLPQRWLRSLVWRTLDECEDQVLEPEPGATLAGFPTRAQAIRWLHFPDEDRDAHLARKRLAFDELLEFQHSLQRRRQRLFSHATGLPCAGNNSLMKPFLSGLGFQLTESQAKVLREFRKDLASGLPMRRLLQGDVGSGKTVVAACTALMALESGFNVALMAPTEILAEQHAVNFKKWFQSLGVSVTLRTGTHKKPPAKSEAAKELLLLPKTDESVTAVPQACLVIGTHALVHEGFEMEKLGLVIIDEQHKFGVAQREALLRKGAFPHLLVMTATPIPRTLGLTLYGDLDISVIDKSPPARGTIKTYLRSEENLPKVWGFLRQQLGEGRQAYIVYARVEVTGAGDLKAVTKEWEQLKGTLEPHRVALLHGRLRPEEREKIMREFQANTIQVLMATSVIEVGVDISNATVMIIENADRFGLAQLHQLRGRIGRGAHDSHCILVAKAKTEDSQRRLQVLVETRDGFKVAEADLELRGPGQLLGQEQSGATGFRFVDLTRDLDLIEKARLMAAKLIESQSKDKL